jgi:tetratricopeptide (TPR) repeat protein
MAYVRRRGNQVVIVRGEREPGTGKVRQVVLFTLFTKAEAKEAIGRGSANGAHLFQDLLEDRHSEVKFDWKKIRKAIADNLDALPDIHDYRDERLRARFRTDLHAFARSVVLADPDVLHPAAQLVAEHSAEIGFLLELLSLRLRQGGGKETEWTADNPYFWRATLRGKGVPFDVEEIASEYWERRDLDRAEAAFTLLTGCFEAYAEGHNYLGLIALERRDLDLAIARFERTVEIGRRLFPRRLPKCRYWSDHSTRPFMRGLRNLALTLNEAGRTDEALAVCDRLEKECDDVVDACWHRAVAQLNAGRWPEAAGTARRIVKVCPDAWLIDAFAFYEMGDQRELLAGFLHALLNQPRAVRMVLGERSDAPEGSEEIEDHNAGVSLLRQLHSYLERRSRGAKRFFKALVGDPRVGALADEVIEVGRRRMAQHPKGEREAFDRMMLMRTIEFSRAEATKLSDLARP